VLSLFFIANFLEVPQESSYTMTTKPSSLPPSDIDTSVSPSLKKPVLQPLVWMVLAAFLVRLAYVLIARTYHVDPVVIEPGPKSACDEHYRFAYEIGSIARSIATGHGFASPFGGNTGPTAWIAPVYPYLLAGIFKVFGVYSDASGFVIQAIGSAFAALTCWPIYQIGCRTVGRTAAVWAGWMWALFPFFWRWSSGAFIWDSPLSALLMSLLFLLALDLAKTDDWRSWFRFGLLWGIAALTNPSLLSVLPVLVIWPGYCLARAGKNYLKPALIAGFVLVAMISPWLIRNRMVFGHFVFLRSNFPFELHLSNYHGSNGFGWGGKHPSANSIQRREYLRLGEFGYVKAKKQEVMQFIREYPGEFASLTWRRFLAFWDGDELPYMENIWRPWMIFLESALVLYGLVLAASRRVPGTALYFAVFLFYPLAYYIVAPAPRYRYAIEPLMLTLGVYFIQETAANFRRRLAKEETQSEAAHV
jgi:4-amino-4-deoxy-L-arabinose transferase-like glycosyltransferase